MAKRDKFFFKEKKIKQLKTEDIAVFDAIHSQGWIELEKPYHHGYDAKWVLRDDISRRKDAHLFQRVLDMCGKKVWCKNKDFKVKSFRTKKMVRVLPELKTIDEKTYLELSESMKKFFTKDINPIKNWRYGYNDKRYRCILTYEFVVHKTKAYVTHRREHDSVLYQREAEIESELYAITDGHPWGSYSYGKFWNRLEHKKEKSSAKRELEDQLIGIELIPV